jgi:hypothetical protein
MKLSLYLHLVGLYFGTLCVRSFVKAHGRDGSKLRSNGLSLANPFISQSRTWPAGGFAQFIQSPRLPGRATTPAR